MIIKTGFDSSDAMNGQKICLYATSEKLYLPPEYNERQHLDQNTNTCVLVANALYSLLLQFNFTRVVHEQFKMNLHSISANENSQFM